MRTAFFVVWVDVVLKVKRIFFLFQKKIKKTLCFARLFLFL